METFCGKSILGSLCLSILLIACLSFDVGSAGTLRNSSVEETAGFIHKENYFCKCPDVGIYGFNLDEVLNKCIDNPQCECVNHNKEDRLRYWGCGSSRVMQNSEFECWVKVN